MNVFVSPPSATLLGFVDSPIAERIGWTLLHSLWQFSLVAIVLAILLTLTSRRSAQMRYLASSVGLFAMVLCSVCTFFVIEVAERPSVDQPVSIESMTLISQAPSIEESPFARPEKFPSEIASEPPAEFLNAVVVAEPEFTWTEQLKSTLSHWLPEIVVTWVVGVLLLSVRPLLGWWTVRKLRRQGISEVPEFVVWQVTNLLNRLKINRAVRVVQSVLVEVPAVIGAFRPLILLPGSAITGLSASQLEALLAHELAHVRRHDYLVNLLQTLVETLFFHHPAVWWVSRRMRIEREHCCDDIAVSACKDRITYSQALVTLEGLRVPRPTAVLSSGGGALLSRIRRLAGVKPEPSTTPVWLAGFAVAICAIVAGIVLSGVTPETAQAESDSKEKTPKAEIVWGDPVNGLRSRVSPVSAKMSEDEIEPANEQSTFTDTDEVAFVVELENVSDKPIQLLDTRYGDSFGDSSGKANSNWYGQYLFSFDLIDAEGKVIDRPEIRAVDLDMILGSVQKTVIEPGKVHRFLLRPAKWLSPYRREFAAGTHTVAIHYHGMSERVANRIKEYRPDSQSVNAWSGDVVSSHVTFEVTNSLDAVRFKPVWGESHDGMRAAVELRPHRDVYNFGEKYDVRLHLQNVSDKPITFSAHLWQSELPLTVVDGEGKEIALQGAWYSGWTLTGQYTLKPQQIIVLDAGNLAIAENKEQADKFEHVTNRKLIAPAGKYDIRLKTNIGASFLLKDGKGNVLAPLEGDWKGELTTGALSIVVGEKQPEGEASSGLDRKLSITAKQTTIQEFIKKLSEQTQLSVILDPHAKAAMQFDSSRRFDVDISEMRLGDALRLLAARHRWNDLYFELDGEILSFTTLAAQTEKDRSRLPGWLAPLHGDGVIAKLDENDVVVELYLGDVELRPILNLARLLPKLRRLNIGPTKGLLTVEDIQLLGEFPSLETLELHSLNGDGLGDVAIDALRSSQTLRELSLSECGTTDKGVKKLLQLPKLEKLSLYQEGRLTDAAVMTISQMTQLRELSLNSYVATEKLGKMQFSFKALEKLSALKELKNLELAGHEFPESAFDFPRLESVTIGGRFINDSFAKQLLKCPNLKSLGVSNCGLTDAGLRTLAELPKLEALFVDGANLTGEGFDAFGNSPALKTLRLRVPSLTKTGVRSIAGITTLESIDLSGGVKVAMDDLRMWKTLPVLRSLTLEGFGTTSTLDSLLGESNTEHPNYLALGELTQLQKLTLFMCDISQSEAELLQQKLPRTIVMVVTGGSAYFPANNGLQLDQPAPPIEPNENNPPSPESAKVDETEQPPIREIEGQVFGEAGELEGVRIKVSFRSGREGEYLHDSIYTTGADGKYRIFVPQNIIGNADAMVRIVFESGGYLSRTIDDVFVEDFQMQTINYDQPYWLHRQLARLAVTRTVLKKGVPLSGRMLLPGGKLAVGAKVYTSSRYRAYSWKFHDANEYSVSAATLTDEQGHFELLTDSQATLVVEMEGQAPLILDNLWESDRPKLLNGRWTFELPLGVRPRGRVVTHEGRPIPGAIVTAARQFVYNEFDVPVGYRVSCAADENGEFEFAPLPPGEFQFAVSARLADASQVDAYNSADRAASPGVLPDKGRLPETIPLGDVILAQVRSLDPAVPWQTLEMRAAETVDIHVKVEFPSGRRPDDGTTVDLTVYGQMNGQRWSGISATAGKDGLAKLTVPKGVQNLAIGTGLAFHRRTPDGPTELGEALHLGTVNEDVSGLLVIKPEPARLRVELNLSEKLKRERLNISAFYVREGYREYQPQRQRVFLSSAMQIGNTEYRGSALPGEELILQVTDGIGNDSTVLHEERLTLTSGEDRLMTIDLGDNE